ncbi:hypothetical protein CYMTET_25561 [Cymbomonas tetramitiformis]|uniref:F-box domain-containing protein n=1 Tax=Cymbomonas tetramitiformis TaxID=36881 RepID=A0AAE0FUB0_9CHLO|nr:hypothetical protein CYMTET_25561 [Cymbomonas tetramitiformis]
MQQSTESSLDPFFGDIECARQVLRLLHPSAVAAVAGVNRTWRDYAYDNHLWKELCTEEYGKPPKGAHRPSEEVSTGMRSKDTESFSWARHYRNLATGPDRWRVSAKETLNVLHEGIHSTDLHCLTFTPSPKGVPNSRLAVGGMDGAIRIWQQRLVVGKDGKCMRKWGEGAHAQPTFKIPAAHAGMVTGVEPLGSRGLLSAGSDNLLQIFHGAQLVMADGGPEGVNSDSDGGPEGRPAVMRMAGLRRQL